MEGTMAWLRDISLIACVIFSACMSPACAGDAPGVLFIHGWRGTPAYFAGAAALFESRGYQVSFVRLHDQSDGSKTRAEYLKVTRDAYDTLARASSINAKRITVVGFSFGSYLAGILSQERTVHRLILFAPASYPDEGFSTEAMHEMFETPTRYTSILAWRHLSHTCNSHRLAVALCAFSGDTLILSSEFDSVIPLLTIEGLHPANITRHTIQDARHTLSSEQLILATETVILPWIDQ